MNTRDRVTVNDETQSRTREQPFKTPVTLVKLQKYRLFCTQYLFMYSKRMN